jgi:hypothetical protein
MNCSLLVQTCDNYLGFWPGMLYSLDFNWDFEKIPVYWASEEKNLHQTKFECRGFPYQPNPQIRAICTGKTDKDGFSTRMRIALEQISSKWVIYIQEDMWLLSNPGWDLISELLLFAEMVQAEAIKMHTKLHYYDGYVLEPTKYEIKKTRLHKYSQGHNWLMTHNGAIWNREYLLHHLKDGEDPWVNELEGSKRMSSVPHNHYHYNIYWYSQPGVCEKGESSKEHLTLGPIYDDLMSFRLASEKFNIL